VNNLPFWMSVGLGRRVPSPVILRPALQPSRFRYRNLPKTVSSAPTVHRCLSRFVWQPSLARYTASTSHCTPHESRTFLEYRAISFLSSWQYSAGSRLHVYIIPPPHTQQRGRSCFMRQTNRDAELDDGIYQMGDFGRIMNIAKRTFPLCQPL
jgi:hypothetical protein